MLCFGSVSQYNKKSFLPQIHNLINNKKKTIFTKRTKKYRIFYEINIKLVYKKRKEYLNVKLFVCFLH